MKGNIYDPKFKLEHEGGVSKLYHSCAIRNCDSMACLDVVTSIHSLDCQTSSALFFPQKSRQSFGIADCSIFNGSKDALCSHYIRDPEHSGDPRLWGHNIHANRLAKSHTQALA